MPNLFWIWWLFELFLYFIADISPYILVGILLWWVAKIRLSQRHGLNSLIKHRVRDSFFQDRFYEERFRSEKVRQDQFLDE